MSVVIRLKNTGKYLTRKGMVETWSDDIGRARLFSKPGDTIYTIEQGDARFHSFSYNLEMVESGEISPPVEIEIVEAVMSAGDVVDTYIPDIKL